MTNLVPVQIDKDTGRTVLSRSGLGANSGAPPGFLGTFSFVHIESVISNVWTVVHNAESDNFTVQVFDATGRLIIPDEVLIIDVNTTHILMGTQMSGKAVFMFAPATTP